MQYNLSVQKDFHGNVVTVAYVGNLERHAPYSGADLNAPVASPLPVGSGAPPKANTLGTPFTLPVAWTDPTTGTSYAAGTVLPATFHGAQSLRPYFNKYPGLTTIGWYTSIGSGSYNAAQFTFERRLSHGLSFNANYTYARNLDNFTALSNQSGDGTGYSIGQSHSLDYGNSDLDLRNRGVASVNYTLPFAANASGWRGELFKGWQVNSIGVWNAGQPFTVLNSTNFSGVNQGNSGDRPNRVASSSGGPHHVNQWLNTGVYAAQPVGSLGNAERNTAYGPHFRHLDLSFIKSFPIREATHLEFRAEGFNITNTVNLSTPNTALQTASTFNTITALSPAYTPRVIQFAAKLVF
jgi:hypothetical protein